MRYSILIIGGGNMGGALARRWRRTGATIAVIEPGAAKRKTLGQAGIATFASLDRFTGAAGTIVLAVKPQMAAEVLAGLRARKLRPSLLISIMAGVPLERLKGIASHTARVMPNTPALIGEGVSAIYAPGVPSKSMQHIETLFRAVGRVVTVKQESTLHAVTAVSGSGPAYVFTFMESFMRAAKALGLNEALARALVTQTVKGAALLACAKNGDVVTLRREVTSPKGTTEAALHILQGPGLDRLLKTTVKAAEKRSKQLSK